MMWGVGYLKGKGEAVLTGEIGLSVFALRYNSRYCGFLKSRTLATILSSLFSLLESRENGREEEDLKTMVCGSRR